MSRRIADWAVLRDLTGCRRHVWSPAKSPPPPLSLSSSTTPAVARSLYSSHPPPPIMPLGRQEPAPFHPFRHRHQSAQRGQSWTENYAAEIPDMAPRLSEQRAIRLPDGQLELPLTPHVTLSRATTPGHSSRGLSARDDASEKDDGCGEHRHRQPSLKRHCASSVLEELGAMTDPEYSGPSSWSSAPLPSTTERRWKIRPQLIAVASACMLMLSSGFALAYQSPINDRHLISAGDRRRNHLLAIGCLVGSLAACPILSVGRRRPALALTVSMTAIWLLPLFGSARWLSVTGEIITGALACAATLTALLYVSEISVAECRGSFLAAALASFDVGLLLVVALGAAVDVPAHTTAKSFALDGGRLLAGLGLCLALVAGAGVLLGWPESPRHLAAVNANKVAAEISLRLLRGLDHYNEGELNLILTNVNDGAQGSGSGTGSSVLVFVSSGWRRLVELVQSATTRWLKTHGRRACVRAGLVSSALLFLLPLCGFGTVTALALGLVAERGASTRQATLAAITTLKAATTAATASSGVLDQCGRRRPLLVSLAVQAVSLAVLAVTALTLQSQRGVVENGQDSGVSVVLTLLLLVVAVFSAAAGVGMSTVPWVLAAELPPQRSRPLVGALSAFAYWTGDLISTYLVLVMHETLGAAGVLWMHFLGATVSYFFVFLLVPETRDRALEEIEVYFTTGIGRDIKTRIPSALVTKL